MILILQFRTDQSGWHELKVVYEASGLPYYEFSILNPVSPDVKEKDVKRAIEKAKAIIVGGSGEFGYEVYKIKPKLIPLFEKTLEKVKKPLKELIEADKKYVFGMCFGHQLIADIMGGKVEYDEKGSATGIFPIKLTDKGKNSPIFKGLPNPFNAVLGHQSSVIKRPSKALLLATRKNGNPYQALQYGEKIFTTQFHPELDYKELEYRLSLYPQYRRNFKIEKKPVHAAQVLQNFFRMVKSKF